MPNTQRLLFNHEAILMGATIPAVCTYCSRQQQTKFAPELAGVTYVQMFRIIAEAAARRGILVMMACHRITTCVTPRPTHLPAERLCPASCSLVLVPDAGAQQLQLGLQVDAARLPAAKGLLVLGEARCRAVRRGALPHSPSTGGFKKIQWQIG